MFLKLKPFGPSLLPLLLLLLLLLSALVTTTEATPLARIHVKFSQPPHQIQEHGITTDGGRLVSQHSFLSFAQRNAPLIFNAASQQRNPYYNPINPAHFRAASPTRPQLPLYPPLGGNGISYYYGSSSSSHGRHESGQTTPDFSNGLDYPDPQLLAGDAATRVVRRIYARAGPFFHEVPHTRLLLRNQEERRKNGLNGDLLSSLRPGSTWFRGD